jgi:hypothetical protein
VPRIINGIAAVILIVHGLIHLMGTAVYVSHAQINGLTYKTTLLNGRWELGEDGIRIFGALWVLPAIGFVVVALALLVGWDWWKPVLVAVTLLSLALTALDWSNAFMGTIVDIAILGLIPLGPSIAGCFT